MSLINIKIRIVKKLILITLSILLLISVVNSQSTEKFIRILGNAKHVVNSNGIKLKATLQEVAPNEYRKVRYISLDEVRENLNKELATIGLPSSGLEEIWPPSRNYNKSPSENYCIYLKDKETARKVMDIQQEGLSFSDVSYTFDKVDPSVYDDLALEAIADARRKAKALAKEIGKSVGEILNLEDQSKVESARSYSSSNSSDSKGIAYSVVVTFELLD